MGEQIELDIRKRPGIPIEYQFPQKYLRGVVRDEIRQITGSADLLDEDLDVPDVRKEIKYVLSMRGLEADFREDKVVIRAGEKDDTGEYWKDYTEGRQAS